ncbi:MAG: recombinase zinc beta ribbon domain-containing protein [Pseudomonadota bacterium]
MLEIAGLPRLTGSSSSAQPTRKVDPVNQGRPKGFAAGRLQSQAEVKRFLEAEPAFASRHPRGQIRYEEVHRLLTRLHYAGYIEVPDWGVTRRKGHHQGLITLAEYERIQAHIAEGARVAARADIDADLPLRGAVACASCGRPLISCWSTSKTGAKHPCYLCFAKGCPDYRKSIRRDVIEGAFVDLLQRLQPSDSAVAVARAMFGEIWNHRLAQARDLAAGAKREATKIERQIEQLLDRIVAADSPAVIGAYETRIAKLERDKLLWAEKAATGHAPRRPFDEMFELALGFLANPWKLWESGDLALRRTTLNLAFASRPAYCRREGFRTPETTMPFKVLAGVGGYECGMAGRMGFEPTKPF